MIVGSGRILFSDNNGRDANKSCLILTILSCLSTSSTSHATSCILHNIIEYSLASKLGHFNEVSPVDFYLLSHLVRVSSIDLNHITFNLMVSTLSHNIHHIPYAPVVTLMLQAAYISLVDEPYSKSISDTYFVANSCAMSFCQLGKTWWAFRIILFNFFLIFFQGNKFICIFSKFC